MYIITKILYTRKSIYALKNRIISVISFLHIGHSGFLVKLRSFIDTKVELFDLFSSSLALKLANACFLRSVALFKRKNYLVLW